MTTRLKEARVQELYSNLKELMRYDAVHGLARRLGYASPEELWTANPRVSASESRRPAPSSLDLVNKLLEDDPDETRLAKFLRTNSQAQRAMWDLQQIKELEAEWTPILSKPGYGVTIGGYAYYPNKNLTRWTASDGSPVKSTLANLFLDYGGPDALLDFLYAEPDENASFIIKKKVRQDDYEAGVMRGDHY